VSDNNGTRRTPWFEPTPQDREVHLGRSSPELRTHLPRRALEEEVARLRDECDELRAENVELRDRLAAWGATTV
jgi:hypothetical protein